VSGRGIWLSTKSPVILLEEITHIEEVSCHHTAIRYDHFARGYLDLVRLETANNARENAVLIEVPAL